MATNTVKMIIQFRRDTTANWEQYKHIVPAAGEPCFDIELGTLKIGDGVTTVSALDFINGSTDNIPGLKTPEGGEIFNDYDTNQATAEFAAAFGTQTIAAGKASLAQGTTVFKSGSNYIVNSNKLVYVISTDCDLAISEGEGKYEVISQEALENTVGYPCILTSSGGFVPASDLRVNEAYGTGSFAGGMGAVAYSRASKSLGYRTQTGYPPNAELAAARPEALFIGGSKIDIANPVAVESHDDVTIICGTNKMHILSNAPDGSGGFAKIFYDAKSVAGKTIPFSFDLTCNHQNS
jgi:hypothetical protein